jgi:hypothetical protein
MAKISEFFGLLVILYYRGETGKHNRPHIHTVKQGHFCTYAIDDGTLLEGQPAPADRKRVRKWLARHRAEVMAAWELARAHKPLPWIEPLTRKTPRKNPTRRPAPRYRLVKGLPLIGMVEWIAGNEVRLGFTNGRVVEVKLPGVKDASGARIVDEGGGLDPGDGKGEFAASFLLKRPGRVLLEGHEGKVYVPVRRRRMPVSGQRHVVA